jgi:hypothetical protein
MHRFPTKRLMLTTGRPTVADIAFDCINPDANLFGWFLYVCGSCGSVVTDNGLDDSRRMQHRNWHHRIGSHIGHPYSNWLPSIDPRQR